MTVVVDAAAIAANVALLCERAGVAMCGVVKANGYGHGAVGSARAMLEGGAAMLGVVDIAEAVALRRAGITAPVLVWIHGADPDFETAVQHDVELGISNFAHLHHAAAANAVVHLKFDTGLGRGGFAAGDWARAIAEADRLQRTGGLRVRGVFTHVAGSGEEPDRAQLRAFTDVADAAAVLDPELRHFAASGPLLSLPDAGFDMVRVGIAAYGLHPDGSTGDAAAAIALGLRPAMRLTATASNGVVPLGFRHGLLAASGAPILAGGRTVRVAEVGADRTTLDADIDGPVVLFGDPAAGEPSADAWAVAAGTINYEIVTRAGGAI